MPLKIAEIVRCPRCLSRLDAVNSQSAEWKWICGNDSCAYATAGFFAVGDIPVLIDFENSVLSRGEINFAGRTSRTRWADAKHAILRAFFCSRGSTPANAETFLRAVHEVADHPRVLIIGGATIGIGAEAIHADPDISLIGTDIYYSEITDLIADGHNLPLVDGSIDGVWIQAVLEHVLEPHRVVEEIHRVLQGRGIVYAETPFMQQVHMGGCDFTRFTHSGHRWLFRKFEEISSGVTQGPGTTMLWSIKYFFASLFGTYKIGTLIALAFFWLRFFDRFARRAYAIDGASGIYFLGRRSDQSLSPKEILPFYTGALTS
jgi:SAM-dependent methyltransferase